MSRHPNREYTYLPYNDEQSFDKVQSSNQSRPKSHAYCLTDIVKEASESDTNRGHQLQPIASDPNRGLFPLEHPYLWKSACNDCDERIEELGKMLGVRIDNSNTIRKIIALPPKSPYQRLYYAVEYVDGRYEKFSSSALLKWHPQQMVEFLQGELYEAGDK